MKFVWSLISSLVVLFIAESIGWITLPYSSLPIWTQDPFWNQVSWLAIITIIFTVIGWLCWLAYTLVWIGFSAMGMTASEEAGSFMLMAGCAGIPIAILVGGFAKLAVTNYFVPGFEYTTIWWQVLILTIFVGISSGGSSSNKKKTVPSTSSYRSSWTPSVRSNRIAYATPNNSVAAPMKVIAAPSVPTHSSMTTCGFCGSTIDRLKIKGVVHNCPQCGGALH